MEVIKVTHFKKSFDDKKVHEDVSFYVNEGRCLGLIGGSGSGKSVILRSLIGLEKPDDGKVLVLGQDVGPMQEAELSVIRKQVSYVFQDGALFDSMTVFENLCFPLLENTKLNFSEISEQVSSTLEDFGLAGTENLYKSELSGGMQKRVGLARAMILNPKVLLYDEPTAGLDPANTIKIQNLILRLKKRGGSSILVTHDMPTALAVCDDICLLHRGRIVARCEASELKDQHDHPINRFMTGEQELFNESE